ncbi:YggS family pyridoxal phosphate-dependent enzyme [Coxiella endosymbiont of Amblyomma americanum]|uniref:YggS family pyridoxal phosphate-dependent enzyme n=1 Tax=Coxiella endosymbiont of Amblyomma americanum TaxID=325775 RepID=UPI00057CDB6E|nr:YggS family pyridoxal phosphate-dependent enzyme [Coxiella endosymbiont of Amblyomma americanum]AJC50675.1 alanine racemase [Coxiella endosymbiont of Amblyomma americanum]AUJ58999.1 YggS family pyridoxal phosphate enzyme [Coxiella-like endosymbiont of Amblyomma americanum]
MNIKNIKKRIRAAEKKYGRKPNSVILLAVSKSQHIDKLKTAISEGQTCFGENYVQEALIKMSALRNYALEWHFIGSIQTNKIPVIAAHFGWVHSVSKLKTAEKLNKYRIPELPPLNICIQVNVSMEESKNGISLVDLSKFATEISNFKRLRLRGVMAIPAYNLDFCAQKFNFEKIKNAQQKLIKQGLSLDTLSMGMTHDFQAAIAAGSTMVRIGTGIFGSRDNLQQKFFYF